eukprot:TRINITY_DN2092_c0_g1_i8.p3 TRINITY_DN2092_c0_g1~~TRINITY_DN2092_c0_g1_i8.p3  ORF type:complete len:124 (+),score=11.12 TRINITY_DN2092_c0_g1_i8:1305-1676(+)
MILFINFEIQQLQDERLEEQYNSSKYYIIRFSTFNLSKSTPVRDLERWVEDVRYETRKKKITMSYYSKTNLVKTDTRHRDKAGANKQRHVMKRRETAGAGSWEGDSWNSMGASNIHRERKHSI